MKILLDTCEFLWFITGDPALPTKTKLQIEDPANQVYLSVVSLWEVIKHALGKLALPAAPDAYIPAQREKHGIQSLPLVEPTSTSGLKFEFGFCRFFRDGIDQRSTT